MRKHNLNLLNKSNSILKPVFFCSLIGLIILLFLSGCQNAPIVEKDPLTALSSDNLVYASIPVKGNETLLKTILQKQVKGLSDSNWETATQYIEYVYLGIPTQERSKLTISDTSVATLPFSKYQIIAQGSFPYLIEKTVFSSKNEWLKDKSTQEPKSVYYRHTSGIEATVVQKRLLFFSDNVEKMITNNYLNQYPVIDNEINEIIKPSDDGVIRFYVKDAEPLIANLFKGVLSLAVNTVYGTIQPIQKESLSTDYSISMIMELKTSYAVKPAILLLNLLAKSKGQSTSITQIDETQIQIDELIIPLEELSKLEL